MSQRLLNFWYRSPDKMPVYGWLLWPFEFIYKKIYFSLKKRDLRKRPESRVPVIVVGNLTVGGTGKTPVVIALVEHFQNQHYRVGVITRGYKSKNKNKKPYLISNRTEHHNINQTGDEALLIYQRTGAPVAVCPDRLASMNVLIDSMGCNLIISDDGLQHHCLPRQLEIVVVDGERGFGNERCLPFGPLREPLDRLRDIDFILINQSNINNIKNFNQISNNHLFEVRCENQGFYCLLDKNNSENNSENSSIDLNYLIHKSNLKLIHAITGIGNPNRFFINLRELGLNIPKNQIRSFPDHYAFCKHDFDYIPQHSLIIMTEKDAVKCLNFADSRFVIQKISAVLPEHFFHEINKKIILF